MPKEIQHRVKRRDPEPEPEPELPALIPPPSLTVSEEGDRLVIAWADNPRAGYLAVFGALAMSPIVSLSLLGLAAKVGYMVFLTGLAFSGFRMSRPRPRLWIDRTHLSNPLGDSFPLASITSISTSGPRVLAERRADSPIHIDTRDPAQAAYIADLLARRLEQRQLDSGNLPSPASRK